MTPTTARLIALLNVVGMKTIVDAAGIDARLLGLGLVDACSRCSGGGSYGPQCVKGGVCFKCGGSGKQAMRHTEALVARVEIAVAAGELAAYTERLQAAARARREAKGAFERAWSGYSRCAWYRFFYEKDATTGRDRGVEGFPIRGSLVDQVDEAYRRAVDLDIQIKNGRGTEQSVADLLVACADYTKALEILDRAHAVCLERGLYEQATAEHLAAKSQERFAYEAECRSRAKWAKVAAEIWAEVGGV
jgi:tetratricopeptide (TPR) repeat protein